MPCGIDASSPDYLDWQHPVIVNSFGTGPSTREQRNLFLVNTRGEMIGSYYIGNVTLSGGDTCNLLCVDSWRGRFHIQAEGRGISVLIRDATPGNDDE